MNFRIAAPHLDFYVDVRLRNFADPHVADGSGGRWLAVAEIAGEHEMGLGSSPREALAASLSSLGAQATSALLADPQLIGVTGSVMGRNRQ